MTNIRDFAPGASEQRGAITVSRYATAAATAPAFNYNHDANWRFSIAVTTTPDGTTADEIWIRLSGTAIRNYSDDDTILTTVAIELLNMARTVDPTGTLADGRKLSDVTLQALYGG